MSGTDADGDLKRRATRVKSTSAFRLQQRVKFADDMK
jgi:hypothetical protein